MKNLTVLALSIAILHSCTPTQFFQVYKTNSENSTTVKDRIVFEDENCKVSYDLWADHGDSGFYIFNKSDSDLTIDLKRSFFVLNGFANSFYQSQKLGTDLQTLVMEQPERIVPPQTMIYISDLQILENRLIQCDLIDRPSAKEIQVIKFDVSTSPIVFYNLITYNKDGEFNRLETRFYVSELTNLPESQMIGQEWKDACGKKLSVPKKTYIPYAPDKFYIDYKFYVR